MRAIIDHKQASTLVVVSGIPAGESGTGRFVAHLQERLTELAENQIQLVARPERPARWQIGLWLRDKAYLRVASAVFRYLFLLSKFWLGVVYVWMVRDQGLILLHPQNLGYRLAIRLLDSRTRPALVYLLDSSFFCVASYNHIKGENGACLRCLGSGYDQVKKNGCKPFPRLDWAALEFAPSLQRLVKAGRVGIAAQSQRQAELAQKHFGFSEPPPVVGLWTQDWDEVIAERPWISEVQNDEYSWDVLFHGHCLDAKGASWIASVAARCPELRFMFPFAKPDWFIATGNCCFIPCSWESGLREEIRRSRFTMVPSLWSAPIEGALVKSIICARAVAVVDNPTSYCDELSPHVVLKLSADPAIGAEELRQACRDEWQPDLGMRARWIEEFAQAKEVFVPRLLSVAKGSD